MAAIAHVPWRVGGGIGITIRQHVLLLWCWRAVGVGVRPGRDIYAINADASATAFPSPRCEDKEHERAPSSPWVSSGADVPPHLHAIEYNQHTDTRDADRQPYERAAIDWTTPNQVGQALPEPAAPHAEWENCRTRGQELEASLVARVLQMLRALSICAPISRKVNNGFSVQLPRGGKAAAAISNRGHHHDPRMAAEATSDARASSSREGSATPQPTAAGATHLQTGEVRPHFLACRQTSDERDATGKVESNSGQPHQRADPDAKTGAAMFTGQEGSWPTSPRPFSWAWGDDEEDGDQADGGQEDGASDHNGRTSTTTGSAGATPMSEADVVDAADAEPVEARAVRRQAPRPRQLSAGEVTWQEHRGRNAAPGRQLSAPAGEVAAQQHRDRNAAPGRQLSAGRAVAVQEHRDRNAAPGRQLSAGEVAAQELHRDSYVAASSDSDGIASIEIPWTRQHGEPDERREYDDLPDLYGHLATLIGA